MKTVLWWVSWEEHDSPEDVRPLTSPPGPSVLAWWCSGHAGDDSYATMVALVHAADEDAADKAVATDWPSKNARVWRFKNECADFNGVRLTLGDRFPLSDWSKDRLRDLGVTVQVKS